MRCGGVDALYAPRRTVLDRLLVDAAEEAGVEVRFGVRVTGLLQDEVGRVVGVRASDDTGRSFVANARLTMGADGIRSTAARYARAKTYREGLSSDGMVYGYCKHVEVEGYEWFYRPGLSGGLIPTNDDRVCVWAGAPTNRFRKDLYVGFEPAIESVLSTLDRSAGRRVAAGRRVGILRGFPGLPGFLRRAWGKGWALVGDAGYFKDPLSSHGISEALRDSELLARAVGLVFEGVPEQGALSQYQATRDALSTRLFDVTDAIASYRWSLKDVARLQLDMSAAMRDEIEALLAFDAGGTPVAA